MSIISELSKLIDAGFTKEDITKIYEGSKSATASIYGTKTKTKTIEEPEVKDMPKETSQFDSLTSQLDEITKLIRSSNLIKDEQSKPRTIDDIFESMFDDNREE